MCVPYGEIDLRFVFINELNEWIQQLQDVSYHIEIKIHEKNLFYIEVSFANIKHALLFKLTWA